MNYTEFKTYFNNDIFNNYLNGNKGIARVNIAAMYRQGKENPRATLYQIYSGMEELQDMFSKTSNEEKVLEYKNAYLDFLTDLLRPDHPMIKSARDEMSDAYLKMYKNPKTLKITRFVLLKQQFPFLKNMKFLVRFL